MARGEGAAVVAAAAAAAAVAAAAVMAAAAVTAAAVAAAVVAAASCLRRWSPVVQVQELGRCEEVATLGKQRSAPQRDRAQPRSAAQTGALPALASPLRPALASPLRPALVSGLVAGSCADVPVQQAPQLFGDTAQRPPAPPVVCSPAPLPVGGARGRHVWLPGWCGCQHAKWCSPCLPAALAGSLKPHAGFGAKTCVPSRFHLLSTPNSLTHGGKHRRQAPRWHRDTPHVFFEPPLLLRRAAAGSTLGQGGSS